MISRRVILSSCQNEKSVLVEDAAHAKFTGDPGPYAAKQKEHTERQSDASSEASAV